jgi:hypothetical protein
MGARRRPQGAARGASSAARRGACGCCGVFGRLIDQSERKGVASVGLLLSFSLLPLSARFDDRRDKHKASTIGIEIYQRVLGAFPHSLRRPLFLFLLLPKKRVTIFSLSSSRSHFDFFSLFSATPAREGKALFLCYFELRTRARSLLSLSLYF